jgi:hypothetical protein
MMSGMPVTKLPVDVLLQAAAPLTHIVCNFVAEFQLDPN